MPWDKVKKTEGTVLKEYAISNGITSKKIFVTKDVENTADDAVAVKELIGTYKSIILVTSAYHMYRAKRLFEKQGFKVTPCKVDYKVGRKKEMEIMDFLSDAESLRLTEIEIKEVFGRIFNLIKN